MRDDYDDDRVDGRDAKPPEEAGSDERLSDETRERIERESDAPATDAP